MGAGQKDRGEPGVSDPPRRPHTGPPIDGRNSVAPEDGAGEGLGVLETGEGHEMESKLDPGIVRATGVVAPNAQHAVRGLGQSSTKGVGDRRARSRLTDSAQGLGGATARDCVGVREGPGEGHCGLRRRHQTEGKSGGPSDLDLRITQPFDKSRDGERVPNTTGGQSRSPPHRRILVLKKRLKRTVSEGAAVLQHENSGQDLDL